MTALDYLRSKARNVNLDTAIRPDQMGPLYHRRWPTARIPYRGLVDFADPQVDPQTGFPSAPRCQSDHILLPGKFTVQLLLDVRETPWSYRRMW